MKPLPCFYAILDLDVCDARALDPAKLARRWCDLGVRLIQLRAKSASSQTMYAFCRAVAIATAGYGQTRLIVNDRIDICLALGLHGVHLPADGIPIDRARVLVEDRLLGRSCHNHDEIKRAIREGIDFVTLSPIFSPNSKQDVRETLGLEVLKTLYPIPVYALGGMTFDRARRAIDCGAYGVAMLGEISNADLPDSIAAQIAALEPT